MIKSMKLNCGAEVVMEKIPYVRSTSVGVWVKVGSVNETKRDYGISHFIEHMMFKGTPTRSAREIAADIDRIGGQINAFTSKENTCYYVKALDSSIETAIEVLCDILFHSVFDEVELEKERRVIYEEINMHDDSPEDVIHDLFYSTIFHDNPLGTPVLGTKEILSKLTRDDLKDYVENNYTVGNVVISIAGNFDEEKIVEVLESNFKELSKHQQKVVAFPLEYVPKCIYQERDIEQVHLNMGIRGMKLGDDLHYAYSIVSNILGGSMSSRLFQSIREEKGMAYAVYSYLSAYTADGTFTIYAGVGQENLPHTVELIIQQLSLLKKQGILEEEFLAAKEQLKSSYIFSLESVSSRMASIGKSQLLLKECYEPEEALKKITDVNMEQIEEVINLFTDLDKYTVVALGRKAIDLKEVIDKART